MRSICENIAIKTVHEEPQTLQLRERLLDQLFEIYSKNYEK